MDLNIQHEIEQMYKELLEGGLDMSWLPRRVDDFDEQKSIHLILSRRMPGHKRRQQKAKLESVELAISQPYSCAIQ